MPAIDVVIAWSAGTVASLRERPRLTIDLHRSADGTLLSNRIWSSRLLSGRQGGRLLMLPERSLSETLTSERRRVSSVESELSSQICLFRKHCGRIFITTAALRHIAIKSRTRHRKQGHDGALLWPVSTRRATPSGGRPTSRDCSGSVWSGVF